MKAVQLLDEKPDVLLIQGSGILHARRLGISAHVGVLLDIPTIGIAKKQHVGDIVNNTIYLEKEARGYVIETKKHANPIFVSPGHKVSLKTSSEIVKSCIVYPHKFPEPIHIAQKFAVKMKKA